jgi:hypothetical protein
MTPFAFCHGPAPMRSRACTAFGPLWAWLGVGEVPAGATLAGGAVVLAALAGNELAALSSRTRSRTASSYR